MNLVWYHIRKLALVILLVVLAVAPAAADGFSVYQGQTTQLSIDSNPGETYYWELYNDSTVDFAIIDGITISEYAEFVNGINSGPQVDVLWHHPGTYFFKITTLDATQCTNNIQIGRIVILEQAEEQIEPPIAYDDYVEVDCDPLLMNVTDDHGRGQDWWDDQYNITVDILEWPLQGDLQLGAEEGDVQYTAWFGVFGTDSFQYVLCLDIDETLCDTATVYINIPAGLDCADPVPPVEPIDTSCHFFIPEGFSPNGDGVHDYFVVDCIDRYPDAKMMIFDKQGYLLYEKENYGNVNVWGMNDADLWWGGQTTKRHHNGDEMVVPGVYLYILDKGNGDLERGFVMVAYGQGNVGNY